MKTANLLVSARYYINPAVTDPVPPSGCDCPNPARCVHYAQQAERDAGARWAAEESYWLRIADEAGRAEAQRRSGDYAERMGEERARLLGQSPDDDATRES